MSTYLVKPSSLGDFQCSSSGEQDVASPYAMPAPRPTKLLLTTYGVDVAKYVLHYYNNYFGIPYPLKKLDLIGLPDTFEAGAMENFLAPSPIREHRSLLIDPKTASINAKTGCRRGAICARNGSPVVRRSRHDAMVG